MGIRTRSIPVGKQFVNTVKNKTGDVMKFSYWLHDRRLKCFNKRKLEIFGIKFTRSIFLYQCVPLGLYNRKKEFSS